MRFQRFAALVLCVGAMSAGMAACGDDDDGVEGAVNTATEQVGSVADDARDAIEGADLTLDLQEQNGSGVTGEVTLTGDGDQTTVTVDLEGAPGMHPAHVHEGTCADLNPAPKFPLADASNDETETMVPASLETIQSAPHAINVHESAQNLENYVACVDIPVSSEMGTTTTP